MELRSTRAVMLLGAMIQSLPRHQQLTIPLMQSIAEAGGKLRCADACRAVAERLGLDDSTRSIAQVYQLANGREKSYRVLDRRIRWVKLSAVREGLLYTADRGIWQLTERGEKMLTTSQPGVAVVVAVSDLGNILWADAITTLGLIENNAIQLAFTSPPFPLLRQRDYGGWSPDTYIETLLRHIDRLKNKLTLDGSLILNLADVYTRGAPVLNLYQEQIALEMHKRGWNLCGRTAWIAPGKPKNTDWVTKARCRLANGFEILTHWSPVSRPFADNRQVLEPYSARYLRTLEQGGELRGKDRGGSRMSSPGIRYSKNNGGRIPFNVITATNSNLGPAYSKFCREQSIPMHPATMPLKVADFCVRFASRPGDLVVDPFGGSLTTALACERNGRNYIVSDQVLEFVKGGLFKLRDSAGLACMI